MIKAIFRFIRDAVWLLVGSLLAIAFGMAIGGGPMLIELIMLRVGK